LSTRTGVCSAAGFSADGVEADPPLITISFSKTDRRLRADPIHTEPRSRALCILDAEIITTAAQAATRAQAVQILFTKLRLLTDPPLSAALRALTGVLKTTGLCTTLLQADPR